MTATVTKIFEFSASHSEGARILAHNYVLRATFHASDKKDEQGLSEKIDRALIRKLHSKDLGENGDILKNKPLDDLSLLKVFWGVVVDVARPVRLCRLTLQRDRTTQWTLTESDGARP